MPGRAGRSLSFDGGAQAAEGLAQLLVFDRQGGGHVGGRGRVGRRGGGRRDVPPKRGLPQRDATDGGPTEEAVDALQDYRRLMLDLDRRRPLDAQNQGGHAAGTGGFVTRQSNKSDSGGGEPSQECRSCVLRRRRGDLDRLAISGDLGPGDVGPARDDLGRGKALPP